MPSICDLGEDLVRNAKINNFETICIPGPSAALTALISSGFTASKFIFEGFPPRKKLELRSLLKTFEFETRTIIFYESPHKIIKTLNELKKYFGDRRKISISREMTKIFEETFRGSLEA